MAGYLATWGPKRFVVSPTKIVPFQDFKTTYTLKEDSENDTSGTAPTNTRGRELQTMTFSTTYLRAAGTDPQAQIKEWESLLGIAHPLYIRGQRFGPAKMMLTQVDVSNVEFSNSGVFLKAAVSITLKEYAEGKTTNVKSGTSTSSSGGTANRTGNGTGNSSTRAANVYAETVEKKKAEAMKTTATKNDRAMKKATLMERRLQA